MSKAIIFGVLISCIAIPGRLMAQKNKTVSKGAEQDSIHAIQPPDGVYTYVEQIPSFPGKGNAEENTKEYLSKNMRYPADAKNKKITGRVVITFIVSEEGDITDPRIVRSVYPSLDTEALRLVKNMPRWHPAINNNKIVKCMWVMPVNFTLY
jgi:TonB family protein